MPTPLQILIDPVSIAVLAIYASLMLWEAAFPARALPRIRGWRPRGLAAFIAFFYLSSYLPLFWDAHLARYQLVDLSGLGTAWGAVIGFVVYEVTVYAWHRSLHGSNVLWRGIHQMHHSAERLDTFGAFYFSPLGMVGWTLVGSFALVLIVGVTPGAATIVILATTFLAIFQHANIKTPRWLGYIVQRPESHSIHHGKGVHYYNFTDLAVIDMIFGTFRNPETFAAETGFYPGASARVLDMVLFRDLGETPNPVALPAAQQ
ncbi:MAG: sterol desaturase family protein [Alphaproteobacteria bacterium]|nr:sterol desaturase family protein [Alphaproteobacteria bacterium]